MWRSNAFPESQDSDQSISEEEEGLNGDLIKHTISLGGPAGNESKTGIYIDDEVENPIFDDEEDAIHLPSFLPECHSSKGLTDLPTMISVSHFDEEIISDDEKVSPPTLESAKANVGTSWSEASREVDELVWLHENSGCSSSQDGRRTNAKSKLLFCFQSHKKDQSWIVSDGKGKTPVLNFPMPSDIGSAAHGDTNKVIDESQLILHEKESEQQGNFTVPSELVHKQDCKEQSVAEFLDCLQERSGLMPYKLMDVRKIGRKAKMVKEKIVFPLGGDNNWDDDEDDLPEALDGGPPTPNDNEETPESLKPNVSGRTMADQFHEAFGTMSALDGKSHFALPRATCGGLFGKLQQVMRSEKERDTKYLKKLNADTSSMVEKIISVRILSRSLEAKLTVCSCTCLEDDEKNKSGSHPHNSCSENNFQTTMKSMGRIMTVIFSPRICSNVELDVGNLIHIHAPWKEVKVKGRDEIIILCSYFSQIPS